MLMLLSKGLTLEDAARFILNGHERTLVFHDESTRLIGVLSQGDVLRAIWTGISTKTPIEDYINLNPLFIDTLAKNKGDIALKLFADEGVLVIPELDSERKIVKIILVRELVRRELS